MKPDMINLLIELFRNTPYQFQPLFYIIGVPLMYLAHVAVGHFVVYMFHQICIGMDCKQWGENNLYNYKWGENNLQSPICRMVYIPGWVIGITLYHAIRSMVILVAKLGANTIGAFFQQIGVLIKYMSAARKS